MKQETKQLKLDEVVYRDDLYPRIKADPKTIQKYAENISVLPPIEVNQYNELIDGFHRWTAHKKVKAETIAAIVTETKNETELLSLAIKRNSKHGLQMSLADKKNMAIRLYASGAGMNKDDIAKTLSVSKRSVSSYVSDIDKQLREERKAKIKSMWLACYTLDEIADVVGLAESAIRKILDSSALFASFPKVRKNLATFNDADFEPPIYNIWSFASKTNSVSHFGNSEQRILENLLYLYTEPFDIVVDPFCGGGSTIDACKKRSRRYYASDLTPIVERETEIRPLDIVNELPDLNNRWSDVALTYLDPPYWKQAEGEYSKKDEDLANMSLEDFTNSIAGIIKRIASKQSKGVIALLIQPTQWKTNEAHDVTDHIIDVVSNVNCGNLKLKTRVSCPYSTQQYTPQMVNWAKENKELLVLTRELIIWQVG